MHGIFDGVDIKHVSSTQVKEKVFQGTIDRWVERPSSSASFGFIEYSPGGARLDRIFFRRRNMVPDNVGRTHVIPGNLVQFKVGKVMHKGNLAPIATDIVPAFACDVEDPDAYREVSIVNTLHPGFVMLKRRSNDLLFLHRSDVAPDFRDLFPTLRPGSRLWHGVDEPAFGRDNWRAVNAEIFES